MTEALNLPLVLEPEALLKVIDHPDLLIIDLCKTPVYKQVHLPSAVHLEPKRLQLGLPPIPGLMPEPEVLETMLQEIGLTDHKHVIVYDDEGGGWAGRMIWTLDMVGHQKYSYLNGGLHAWLGLEFPISQEPHPGQASPYKLQALLADDYAIDLHRLMQAVKEDQVQIWDARSEGEYTGQQGYAKKAGRIPGAKHFEWTQGMDPDRQLRILPIEQLRERLKAVGITGEKPIVTHCQTHHRSGFTYLLGKVLGFDMKAYPGSWAEWGNHPDTPVQN